MQRSFFLNFKLRALFSHCLDASNSHLFHNSASAVFENNPFYFTQLLKESRLNFQCPQRNCKPISKLKNVSGFKRVPSDYYITCFNANRD